MKNKLEQKMDAEFVEMKIEPMIFYFREQVSPFTSITIAINSVTSWNQIRAVLANYIGNFMIGLHASTMLKTLREIHGIYGVAICDKRDQFNRQRGRIIAKGRLLKHLKEMNK